MKLVTLIAISVLLLTQACASLINDDPSYPHSNWAAAFQNFSNKTQELEQPNYSGAAGAGSNPYQGYQIQQRQPTCVTQYGRTVCQ